MADPLEVLRSPAAPVDPDPAFATRLRARLTRALALPKGVTVSNVALDVEPEPDLTPAVEPALTPVGVIPYLIVSDARRAIDWYVKAMGARRRGEPIVMPDGRIGHAEIEVAGGIVYLAGPSPTSRVAPPEPGEPARVSLTAQVADLDRFVDRAVAAGAELERAPEETPYGVHGVIVDPYGHRWLLSSPSPSPAAVPGLPEESVMREGDVGYASLMVPDVERAKAFFGSVLGWTFGAGSSEQGAQVEGLSMSHGLWGGQERSNLLLCFAVDDVDTAVERVWAAGGRVEEPTDEPYGRLANCMDDQGMAFAVFTPPPGVALERGPANGQRHGDLSYLTVHVVDAARTRAFFRRVLGWQFTPGRVEDGWNVDGTVPMTGLSGGHAVDTVVPMYRVDDVAAAVQRVRAAGGTATDPEPQPYGWTSECVDDQGTRFFLGEL